MDLSTLSSRKTMQRSINLVPPSQQRLHKQQFLHKLNRQKPYWVQARLSSLVNKQVVAYLEIVHKTGFCWQALTPVPWRDVAEKSPRSSAIKVAPWLCHKMLCDVSTLQLREPEKFDTGLDLIAALTVPH